ncbi:MULTISPECIES: hypothetical protein [Myroides]|uniref:DUF2846 domain-containing protein n=1 Tax=Myroides albus TaxID=2562892 RepID=A0A6I3LMF5_9FLAO|nr:MULTISPECIES: hypothetical protein [Myroides]MTG98510.1 hypothetical protein [Myroides albus]MVX36893.1 hypothetical protein [Myroides sp. LoEW2-1]UVD79532.1 hypothetical protein NWE55_15625 [Myroides albus]
MAKIVLKRKKAIVDRHRNYIIFLDGEKLCSISNGEEVTFDVAPGKHILSGKIDWNSSNAIVFEIKDEHTILFTIRGCNPLLALYYTFAKPSKYLKLKKQGYL